MSNATPRLRIFAGPNGSGKSTLKKYLPEELLGYYLNPDELEQSIRVNAYLDLSASGLNIVASELLSFLSNSLLLKSQGLGDSTQRLRLVDNRLDFSEVPVNSYFFDNSGDGGTHCQTWLAEITDGKVLQLKSDRMPAWFKRYILDKASGSA